ncbi:hypothetical protein T05_10844 [Trichinella murrelli]|uniref:Uncharacterized protein n=1 Tax=Trichinella murrelli TaxID=144512 RepID=A0A0V0SW67_9BILA|nr:hypothetical protein T05_10844 [Trichinella murrelli]
MRYSLKKPRLVQYFVGFILLGTNFHRLFLLVVQRAILLDLQFVVLLVFLI